MEIVQEGKCVYILARTRICRSTCLLASGWGFCHLLLNRKGKGSGKLKGWMALYSGDIVSHVSGRHEVCVHGLLLVGSAH